MGYSLHRQLVEQNISLLEDILSNLKQNKETIIPSTPDEISSMVFSINRILKASQMFISIFQGKYSKIRDLVKVHPSSSGTHISIQPKGKSTAKLLVSHNTEAWVILFLNEYQGNLVPVDFYPSPHFNEASFSQQMDENGWTMHLSTKREEEDKLTYVFERKEEITKSGFDLLKRYQSLPSD
jgi:hypothetical protein